MERTTLHPVVSFLKQVSVVGGKGKTTVSPLYCNPRQHKLAEGMPLATERVGLSWISDTHPNAAVCRDHLENDVEGRIVDWRQSVMVRFSDCYADDGQRDPPQVVTELRAKLFI